ncbi:nab2 [Pungitius sinensis]
MSLPRTLGELQLYRVLQRANLLAYYETFIQQGGDDVQQLCEAAEEEFLEIMALVGMATKPLHVRRLQKALRDWAANPALFSQPVSNVPLGGIPLFKVDGAGAGGSAGGPRRSVSNGQPGSPCEREDRACLTPMHNGSPRSPCSQASPQPPDTHYREKLSPMDPHWLSPDPDGNCTLASGLEEEPPSPPLLSTSHPGPSTSPSPSASVSPSVLSAWPGGQLDGETERAVVESVERLLRTLPRSDPAEVKTLLRMNKKIAKTVGHIFKMGSQDVNKEEEIRKYSLIYGRFDSKRREGKLLTHHELIINEAAAQFCMRDNALLLRRVELFSLARQVARKCAYTSTLKHARTNADENSAVSQKRARHEVILPESVSLVLGVEGSEGLTQRGDDDSLSAESIDSVSHDIGSQCNQSASPRPHTDTSNPASWSRHLIQQTLMDEGLRLARMVSHDRAGKISLGSERTLSTEHDSKVERRSLITVCRSSSPCLSKDDSNHRGK